MGSQFGIHPFVGANHEGLPFISVSGGFSLGNDFEGELPQAGNSFQWSDSLSKGFRQSHFEVRCGCSPPAVQPVLLLQREWIIQLLRRRAERCRRERICIPNYLLGLPDSYGQGSPQGEKIRNTGLYLFAQDSWKIRPNLTLNYGLRWELNTPLADKSRHVETFRAGRCPRSIPCGGRPTRIAVRRMRSAWWFRAIPVFLRHDPDLLQGICAAYRHCVESGEFRQDQHPRRMGTFLQSDRAACAGAIRGRASLWWQHHACARRNSTCLFSARTEPTYPNPFHGVITPPRGSSVKIGRCSSRSICSAISSRICVPSTPRSTT